jgi:hypothetical protein
MLRITQPVTIVTSTTTIESSTITSAPNARREKIFRLPKDLVPHSYELLVQPIFRAITKPEYYEASVKVHLTCMKSTNRLIMHMKSLEINNASLRLTSDTQPNYNSEATTPLDWRHDEEAQLFIVDLNEPLTEENNYTFYAEFRGFIGDENSGFYRSSYNDSKGTRK